MYPTDYPGREARRQMVRTSALKEAERKRTVLGRSINCGANRHAGTPGGCKNDGAGCLCECHDFQCQPLARFSTDEAALAQAFTEWDRRFREEPDRFESEACRLLKGTPETYGEACAPYLIALLMGDV